MLSQDRVIELFNYDPLTGELVWKVTKSATAVVGSIAGSLNDNGHVNLQIDKTMYSAHQVVFLYHNGYIPLEIDHIDKNKANNRIENLRPCNSTAAQNKGNIGLLRTNTSGYKGVSLNRSSGKYHAQIKIAGKQTYLGRFSDPVDAALCYNKAALDYFGEFAHLNEVYPKWLR